MADLTPEQSKAIAREIAALADDFARVRSSETSNATNTALGLLIEALNRPGFAGG